MRARVANCKLQQKLSHFLHALLLAQQKQACTHFLSTWKENVIFWKQEWTLNDANDETEPNLSLCGLITSCVLQIHAQCIYQGTRCFEKDELFRNLSLGKLEFSVIAFESDKWWTTFSFSCFVSLCAQWFTSACLQTRIHFCSSVDAQSKDKNSERRKIVAEWLRSADAIHLRKTDIGYIQIS